jgi:hypothetical protein
MMDNTQIVLELHRIGTGLGIVAISILISVLIWVIYQDRR